MTHEHIKALDKLIAAVESGGDAIQHNICIYAAHDSKKWGDLSRVEKGEVLLSLREGAEYEFSTDGVTWNKLYAIMCPRDSEYVRKKRKVHRPWELSKADGTTKVHLGSVKHERVDLPNTKQFAYRILEQ